MNKNPIETCGCKGVRFCALCENTERVKKLRKEEPSYDDYSIYVYSSSFKKALQATDLRFDASMEDIVHAGASFSGQEKTLPLNGLLLIEDFLSMEEEEHLMQLIETTPWAPSQSGRRKQDYGPKVNFKHKKVKTDTFVGMPEYADLLLGKMRDYSEERLGNYQPFEMCNLEYEECKKSAIEMHQDDMWIWGNRLISINLISGSIMTLTNDDEKIICFVPMPHKSLLCMADDVRYKWKHGVLSRHIKGRRIALTMREPALEFQEGGSLYEKFGKELIRIGNQRVILSK